MERLTTNKSVSDMSMVEQAHNSCYVDSEGNARYRDYEMEMDARDFARNLMVTLTKEELPVDDTEFDEEILDNLTIDPFSDVRGLIAMFYRNMWAMADLREKLKRDEDAEEQGLLLRLPDEPEPKTLSLIKELTPHINNLSRLSQQCPIMLCPMLIVTDKLLANFRSNRIDSAFLATLIRIKKRTCHIIRFFHSRKQVLTFFDMVLTDISVNSSYLFSAHW